MRRSPTLTVGCVLTHLALATVTVIVTVSVSVILVACGSAPTPATPATPAAPAAPAPGPSAAPSPGFELVESVPIETTLDHPDLRDASDVWLDMIAGAHTSIDLAQFYASNHQPSRLEPIVAALEAAAARGVRIRFLAEQAFVKTYPDTLDRLARAGASIRHLDLKAVPGQLLFADWSKRPKTITGLQKLARIPNIAIRLTTIPPWSGGFIPFARVTHAKALVVDGTRGWLGTSNWEKDYFYKSRNLGVIIDDPALAAQLTAFFASLWQSPYAIAVDPDATYTPPRVE